MTTATRFIVALMKTLGGLSPARRAFVVCGVIVCSSALAEPVPTYASDSPSVHVVEKHGRYQVSTTFSVTQPLDLAQAVLTDYENIPAFMTDVRLSRVIERGAGRVVVEQEAVARVLFFSRRIHLTLDIVETPGRIRFRDRCGKSFVHYEGSWRLDADERGTTITYELAAQPTTDVPAMIVRRLLSRDVEKTIDQLRREMARRAGERKP